MPELSSMAVYKFINEFDTYPEFMEFVRCYLELKEHKINEIRTDNSGAREQKFKMIRYWKREIRKDGTINDLYAMKNGYHFEAYQQIQVDLSASQPAHGSGGRNGLGGVVNARPHEADRGQQRGDNQANPGQPVAEQGPHDGRAFNIHDDQIVDNFAALNITSEASQQSGISGLQPNSAGIPGLQTNSAGMAGLQPNSAGISGLQPNSAGISGLQTNSAGIPGLQPNSAGISGLQTISAGISDLQTNSAGISDLQPNSAGISDLQTNSAGIPGLQPNSAGISGLQTNSAGISGLQPNSAGVSDLQTNSAGISDLQTNSAGISGLQPNSADISGLQPNSAGISGLQPNSAGMAGLQTNSAGMADLQPNPAGISGIQTNAAVIPDSQLANLRISEGNQTTVDQESTNETNGRNIDGSVVNPANRQAVEVAIKPLGYATPIRRPDLDPTELDPTELDPTELDPTERYDLT